MHDYDEKRITAYLAGTLSESEAAEFESRMHADAELRREVDAWRAAVGEARDWLEAEPPGAERADRLAVPLEAGAVGKSARIETSEQGPAAVPNRPRARVLALRPVLARALAAAALFAAGICVGSQWPRRADPAHRPPTALAPAKETPSRPAQARLTGPAPGQSAPSVAVGLAERSAPDASSKPGAAPGPQGPRGPAAPPESAGPEGVPEPALRQTAPSTKGPARPVLAQASEAGGGAEGPSDATRRPERIVRRENGRYIIETTLVESGARATWIVDPSLRLADSSAGS